MFFDINKALCDSYAGLDPIKLLDYAAEDVFNLVSDTLIYSKRSKKKESDVIRRPAGDSWF